MFKRFAAGFAVGYVLGARAGEKRYEQLTEVAQKFADAPLVQRVMGESRQSARQSAGRILELVKERAGWDQISNRGHEDDGREEYDNGGDEDEFQGRGGEDDEGYDPDEGDGGDKSADARASRTEAGAAGGKRGRRNGQRRAPRTSRTGPGDQRRAPSPNKLASLAAAARDRGRVN